MVTSNSSQKVFHPSVQKWWAAMMKKLSKIPWKLDTRCLLLKRRVKMRVGRRKWPLD